MEEEEAIKRITRLLEMGGTMLATHHECGAPLFRYKGEVVCPVCSFEEAGPQVPSRAEKIAVESERKPSSISRSVSIAGEEGVSAEEFGGGRGIQQAMAPEARDNGEVVHREAVSRKTGPEDEREPALEELQRAILLKIREISEKMRDEQDLGRLKSQLECVEEALKVLGRLRG